MNTIQDKERIILGTIINCNKHIKKLYEDRRKNSVGYRRLFESKIKISGLYHYNMLDLYSKVNRIDSLSVMNESFEFPSAVNLSNDNYYAYFKKCLSFLNEYEPTIQHSLNESLFVDPKKVKNPTQLDIDSFKKQLETIINQLSKEDETKQYSDEIIKIKTFASKPMFVCGFNICNNFTIQRLLVEKFNLTFDKVIAVVYNKSNKQIMFVTNHSSKIICYDITEDQLDLYQNINKQQLESKEIKPEIYLAQIKMLTGYNALVELYVNPLTLNIKYTDNLYRDDAYMKFRLDLNQQLIKGNNL